MEILDVVITGVFTVIGALVGGVVSAWLSHRHQKEVTEILLQNQKEQYERQLQDEMEKMAREHAYAIERLQMQLDAQRQQLTGQQAHEMEQLQKELDAQRRKHREEIRRRRDELDEKRERELDLAIQKHLDDFRQEITALLLERNLGESKRGDPVQTIARTRTLDVLGLEGLDGKRKGQIIKFLSESRLVNGSPPPIISLEGAELREADLHDLNLIGADLRRANLTRANLAGADLTNANLAGAAVRGVKLRGTIRPDGSKRGRGGLTKFVKGL